ncbi:phage portal protein [Vibrio alginolyticus]|uniref:phage portal protein n=1 Tax=Vibrio alginolyticus TaxID=663 RepID=UPI0035C763F0
MSLFDLFKDWRVFRSGANAGSQNNPHKPEDPKTRKRFNKRTDYADFAFSERPNPYLEAIIKEMVYNSAGGSGISITPMPTKANGDVDKKLQAQLAKLWDGYKDSLDSGGRYSWATINQLIARDLFAGGECFVVECKSPTFRNELGVAYMIKGYASVPFGDLDEYKDGIALDQFGRAYKYRFHDGLQSRHVSAKDVIHAANFVRSDDTRGFSAVAPACDLVVEIDNYDKDTSQLVSVSKRVWMWVISKKKPAFPDGFPVLHIEGSTADTDVKSFASNLTNTYSKDHRKNLMRAACASVGVGYGATTGEIDGSYSASRQEMVVAAQRDLARQNQLIDQAIRPIYERFVLHCLSRGLVRYTEGNIFAARYTAPKREHIDPLKDATATALKLATNQISLTEVIAARGEDFDVYITHLRDEMRKLQEAGLPPNGVKWEKFLEIQKYIENEVDRIEEEEKKLAA